MSIKENQEPSISILECSRRSGVSHTAINKAINSERLVECVDRSGKKNKIWYSIFLKEANEIAFNFKNGMLSDFREDKTCTDIILSLEKYVVYNDKYKLDEDRFTKLYHMLVLYRACLLNPEPVTEFTRYNLLQFLTDPDMYYYFHSGIYVLYSALKEAEYKGPIIEMDIINKNLAGEIKTHYPAVDISRLNDIKTLKAYVESN